MVKVIDELDPETEGDRKGEVESIMRELKDTIVNNEKEVKETSCCLLITKSKKT